MPRDIRPSRVFDAVATAQGNCHAQNSHRLPFNAGNGGSRLRVAITLRRFDAQFASKVQVREVFRELSKTCFR